MISRGVPKLLKSRRGLCRYEEDRCDGRGSSRVREFYVLVRAKEMKKERESEIEREGRVQKWKKKESFSINLYFFSFLSCNYIVLLIRLVCLVPCDERKRNGRRRG